jgi:hypothetical protein
MTETARTGAEMLLKTMSCKGLTGEERLQCVRTRLVEAGQRYLDHDYSQLRGDIAFKRRLIDHMTDGIHDRPAIERAFDQGIKVMRDPLINAATKLRALSAHKPSMFMMGMSGMDDPNVLNQMVATIRGLEGSNKPR